MEIYLIRHTTPDIEKGICYGQSDVPLLDTFEVEAERILQKLPKRAGIIYTSPLSRCTQLAEYLLKKISAPIVKDDRLKEINFGEWEMKPWDDIDKPLLDKWMNDFVNSSAPAGESFTELASRVRAFSSDLAKRTQQKVILVTHAGVIRSLRCMAEGIPLNEAFSLPCAYASVVKIENP
jgi:alpha-ribazole phosphatase